MSPPRVCAVEGQLGGELSITIEEEVHEAILDGPDGLEAWRRGDAFHLIPPEEESSRKRYEKNPIKNGKHVGQFKDGVHFGEICTMHRLRADGFDNWLYEVFELFVPVRPGSDTALRTEIARAALGAPVVEALHAAARTYRSDVGPKIPDLMAWRDRDGVREFRFVESKNERKHYCEPVKPGQLLGLALLSLIVPRSQIHIYRWLGADQYRSRTARGTLNSRPPHRATFTPGA